VQDRLAGHDARRSSGRARLPACVVRIRSALRFMRESRSRCAKYHSRAAGLSGDGIGARVN
jgi:hypothetical protein